MIRPEVALRLIAAALLTAVLMSLAGCRLSAPTAPVVANEPKGLEPRVLVVGTDGSIAFRKPQPFMPQGHELEAGSRSLQASKLVYGGKGGWLRCGRFILVVSPGAFEGDGTITMAMKDSTAMVVDLEISPADKNDFKAPVYLAVNTTGLDLGSEPLSLYWYDPSAKEWVGMSSDGDLAAAALRAQEVNDGDGDCPTASDTFSGVRTVLEHFSTYSAGKAGW